VAGLQEIAVVQLVEDLESPHTKTLITKPAYYLSV
jgi:hypothetical protein